VTSGRKFSENEQRYILDNAHAMSWGQLARDLAEKFPRDNGGCRDGRSVRNWYRSRDRDEKSTIEVEVPAAIADRIRVAGLSPADIGALVTLGLQAKG
jgi:hypothetical protein